MTQADRGEITPRQRRDAGDGFLRQMARENSKLGFEHRRRGVSSEPPRRSQRCRPWAQRQRHPLRAALHEKHPQNRRVLPGIGALHTS